MTVKELIILFQEWQLETKAPNYNFAHNGVANNFMERYGLKNCTIPDVIGSLRCCTCGKEFTDKDNFILHLNIGNCEEQ